MVEHAKDAATVNLCCHLVDVLSARTRKHALKYTLVNAQQTVHVRAVHLNDLSQIFMRHENMIFGLTIRV